MRVWEGGGVKQPAKALATAEAELIEDNLATKRDIAESHQAVMELEVFLQHVQALGLAVISQ